MSILSFSFKRYVAIVTVVLAVALSVPSAAFSQQQDEQKRYPITYDPLGIEIVALRQTASGHMIDMRFSVLDLEKSKPLFDKKVKPYLIDQASGKSLAVPVPAKLGPMRPSTRQPKTGVVYWMFFGNPGLVKVGNKVTIAIGDVRIEDLVVE